MMDENDLDIGNGSTGSTNSQSVRKNIPIKLKGGKGGSRKGKKAATPRNKKSAASRKPVQDESMDDKNDEELPDQLEFSTMKIAATPAEPLHHNHKLKWDHKVNLMGQKVVDPLIHSCEKCGLPILIYGRMIPCKHVFCFDCAKKTEKHCPRCKDTVSRIEQSALGTVFVCTYGGSKHGSTGCHRTYLSQRDLQAHIDHRHIKGSKEKSSASHSSQQTVTQLTVSQKQQSLATPPQAGSGSTPLMQQTPPQQSVTMPAMSLSHQHPTPDSYAPHSTVASHSNIGSHGSPAPHQTMSMNLGISGPPPQQQPMQDSGMLYHHPHPEEHSQAMLSQAPPGGQIPQHTVPPPLLPPMQHHQQPPPQQAPHQTMPPQPNLLPPPPVASTAHTHLPPPAAGSANLDINYHNRPAMGPSRNTNLITVPIQDERDYSRRDQPIVSYSQPAPMVGGAGGLYSHPPPGPPPQGHYTHPPPQHTLPTSSYPGHQLGAAGVNVSLPSTFSSPPPTHAAQYPNNVAQRPHMQVPPPQVGPPPQTGLPPPRPSAQVPPPSNLRPPMSGPPPQIGAPPPHGPPPTQYPPSQRPPGGPFDPQGGSHPWPSPQGPPPRGPPPQRPQTSSTAMGPPPPHGYYQ